MIQGTYGRTYFDSSASAGLPSSWANRLAARLATLGSTESALIWKVKALPSGRLKPRLVPSTRHTNGCETGGAQWPTPMAGTPAQNGNSYAGNNDSSRRFEMILGLRETPNGPKSQWPTPTVADIEGGRKTRSGSRGDEMLLNGLMTQWTTPTLHGDYNRKGASKHSGDGVATQMFGAVWPTPTVADIEGGRKTRSGARGDEMLLNGLMTRWRTPDVYFPSPKETLTKLSGRTPNDPQVGLADEMNHFGANWATLSRQITNAGALWSTPRLGGLHSSPSQSGLNHGDTQAEMFSASGMMPNGSDAPTAKRGAPNPEFACWLMGWPDVLTSGALQAIQSFRKLRPKSSPRSKKLSTKRDDLFG